MQGSAWDVVQLRCARQLGPKAQRSGEWQSVMTCGTTAAAQEVLGLGDLLGYGQQCCVPWGTYGTA